MPDFVPVALATLDTKVPLGTAWIHEAKLDGYRIEAIRHAARQIQAGQAPVTLWSRNARDWSARFPDVVQAITALPVMSAVLDGEIILPVRQGASAFQALQRSLDQPEVRGVHYVVFDLLHLDGVDLRREPLRTRQELLRALLRHRGARSPLRPVRRFGTRSGNPLAAACALGLEGIVSKERDGRYVSGRHRGWVKVKCTRRQEFVVAGYTEPRGSRTGFGALLLGVHDETGTLIYAGKVGTGFDSRTLNALHERLRTRRVRAAPVAPSPLLPRRDVHWVEPELVAEVAFTEWTADGQLRHPVFHGLREDKRARDVVREEP
jgi:bifunctional non-homologous end joining protein LigD